MPASQILALIVATSFAAGLNVYATVATLGLLDRAGAIELPAALDPIASWWVIAICSVMFTLEFFADKIPAFDLIWNALQTVVRVPVAGLLAYAASEPLSPPMQMLAVAMGSALALAAHTWKISVRASVTPSPEPMSNIALSLAEDTAAIGLTWFAVTHPFLAATVVLIVLVLMALAIRWIFRGLRALFRRWTMPSHAPQLRT
jgi:hypothetical protein